MGKYIILEIICAVLVPTFILHWVLFRLYFTTYVKDQYWSRLITHQWAVKRLLKRALEATENIDHTLLGQKRPWPRTLLALEFHYCPFQLCFRASHCNPGFGVSSIAEGKDENVENAWSYPKTPEQGPHHNNSIQTFYSWVQSLTLKTVGELINHNIYVLSTIY